jgi:Peptidase family M28
LGWRKTALLLGALEGDQRFEPLSRLLSLADSQNVVASIPASGEEVRTLVLVSHLDSSRSGILFHPDVAPRLRRLTALISAAVAVRAFGAFERTAKTILAAGLALLAEREIRGSDVPGANDNASGVAVATALARELASAPFETTRVVFLATGCEESGTGGMRAFLDAHRGEWEDWLFLNLDGVGAPATLRYLPREGMLRILGADPGLIRVCEETARDHPELGLHAAEVLAGLTYDATPVMARGGRAITLSAQDRTIPNYHSAQDVPENLDGDVLARALEATRLVAAAIDRGDADR